MLNWSWIPVNLFKSVLSGFLLLLMPFFAKIKKSVLYSLIFWIYGLDRPKNSTKTWWKLNFHQSESLSSDRNLLHWCQLYLGRIQKHDGQKQRCKVFPASLLCSTDFSVPDSWEKILDLKHLLPGSFLHLSEFRTDALLALKSLHCPHAENSRKAGS